MAGTAVKIKVRGQLVQKIGNKRTDRRITDTADRSTFPADAVGKREVGQSIFGHLIIGGHLALSECYRVSIVQVGVESCCSRQRVRGRETDRQFAVSRRPGPPEPARVRRGRCSDRERPGRSWRVLVACPPPLPLLPLLLVVVVLLLPLLLLLLAR